MFLLLLIAVLVGCQPFSGHCPTGSAVLCALQRKAPGTKKPRTRPVSLCLFQRRGPGMEKCTWPNVVVFFMAWQKFLRFLWWSPREESRECGIPWGKMTVDCFVDLQLYLWHKCLSSGKTIRPKHIEKFILLRASKFSSLIQFSSISYFWIKYFN